MTFKNVVLVETHLPQPLIESAENEKGHRWFRDGPSEILGAEEGT